MNRKKLAVMLSGILLGAPAWSQNPYLQPDDTWIEISGTVTTVAPDSFTLNYGDGTVIVEMDDGDRDADAYKLYEGDKVTVSGMVDDDFLETTTIEASSVFVENLGTTFYASAVDEEGPLVVSTFTVPIVISSGVLQGTVSSVDKDEEEFKLNTGLQLITVEVDEMSYNPLDDEGYQKISVGDQVRVVGTLDNDLFEGRVFEADYVTTLFRNR